MKELLGNLIGYQRKEQARANVAIGTLAGLLVGLATGILVAPQSGKETRHDIKVAAEKGYTKAVDKSKEVAELVKVKGEEAAARFNRAKHDVEDSLNEGVAKAADKVQEGADKVSRKAEKVSDEAKA